MPICPRTPRSRRSKSPPGFINFYLSVAVKNAIFGEARKGMDFAKSNVGGGLKTQVEFVSANPVGPMHIGHGRWAALGDSLCRVMDHAGYDIQRGEFCINDHGSQMNTFGNSISTRYMQLADIIAKQGVDIDEAHKILITTATPLSPTRTTSIPRPIRIRTTLPRPWARTPTAATTSSTRLLVLAHRRRQVGRGRSAGAHGELP